MVVNFPHNPTGGQPTQADMIALIDACRSNGTYIFSDEMYRYLSYDGVPVLTSVADDYERGVSLFGLSKTFSLPGLRIGWLATRDAELLARLAQFKDYTTICASAPSEILAIMAIRDSNWIIERNIEIITGNIAAFDDFVGVHADRVRWTRPRAGSVAFPELLGGRVDELARVAVEDHELMILPASVYNYPHNNFRVGLGRKDFPEALDILGGLL